MAGNGALGPLEAARQRQVLSRGGVRRVGGQSGEGLSRVKCHVDGADKGWTGRHRRELRELRTEEMSDLGAGGRGEGLKTSCFLT